MVTSQFVRDLQTNDAAHAQAARAPPSLVLFLYFQGPGQIIPPLNKLQVKRRKDRSESTEISSMQNSCSATEHKVSVTMSDVKVI
jgi:hypothetical protein